MQENLETVRSIYAAFGRGDVAAILDCLADDVAWESWHDNFAQRAGVPWLKAGRGRRHVAEFFKIVGAFKISKFTVVSLMAGGNQVAAEVENTAEVPATGGNFHEEEVHLWTFNDQGQVVRFRHYLDTAKHIAVAKGERTAR